MTSEEFYTLGNKFRRQGDFKRAMEAYMESIALNPESPAVEAKKMLEDIYAFYCKDMDCHRQQTHINHIMGKVVGAIVVNEDRCKGCSLCVVACPKAVIALADRKVNVSGYPFAEAVRPDDCIGCASCAIVCPDGCITVYRKKLD